MSSNLFHEPYRPQFHFTARVNWLNDPNGLVYYKGEYHLFYQYNPNIAPSGSDGDYKIWGHAISPDLVHWEIQPHAILPDQLGSIWSGSAVVDGENTSGFQIGTEKPIVAIYTAAGGTTIESQGQLFTQCIAYSLDRGRTWTKYPGNPVLGNVAGQNRDPKVVWNAPRHEWVMALYLHDHVYGFFASSNLKEWTYLHDLEMPGSSECPDFFPMRVQNDPTASGTGQEYWVFTGANGRYLVGTFDGTRFTPEEGPLQVDYGANYYAVQTFSDAPGARRIQIAWMAGGRYPGMPFNQQMSFPCEMALRQTDQGLRLVRQPVPEIATLYSRKHTWQNLTMQPGENPLAGIESELVDLQAEIEVGELDVFNFILHGQTMSYSVAEKLITVIDRSCEAIPENRRIKIRLLLDRTSLEVFVNDGQVSLTSCYVPDPSDRSLTFHASSNVKVLAMTLFELRSAWI